MYISGPDFLCGPQFPTFSIFFHMQSFNHKALAALTVQSCHYTSFYIFLFPLVRYPVQAPAPRTGIMILTPRWILCHSPFFIILSHKSPWITTVTASPFCLKTTNDVPFPWEDIQGPAHSGPLTFHLISGTPLPKTFGLHTRSLTSHVFLICMLFSLHRAPSPASLPQQLLSFKGSLRLTLSIYPSDHIYPGDCFFLFTTVEDTVSNLVWSLGT